MRLAIIGAGHVGLVTAAVFAELGHEVRVMDSVPERVSGDGAWFHEDGLDTLLERNKERLFYTTDPAEAIADAEVVFACVGTPPLGDGRPNLVYLEQVAWMVAEHANHDVLLVEKSTVPARTGERLQQILDYEADGSLYVSVASNPEFLREGTAVYDTLSPDRIVYGTRNTRDRDTLRRVYEPMLKLHDCPVIETDVASSEMIKHASNAFLATKISFINAVAAICEEVGADVNVVADGMGHDPRIGRQFLNAGIGYGGSCFPKDVDAFAHLAREVGQPFHILDETRDVNSRQWKRAVHKLKQELWHLEGKTITLLGFAFKPGTDDVRESPAAYIAQSLVDEGASVRVFDPIALDQIRNEVRQADPFFSLTEALDGADAAVVCTDWDVIAGLAPHDFIEWMRQPVVIDGRNVYSPDHMRRHGVRYHSFGR